MTATAGYEFNAQQNEVFQRLVGNMSRSGVVAVISSIILLAYHVVDYFGFSVGAPRGNGTFDSRVQSTMQAVVGQQVPPPPPLYPDILPPSLALGFLGKNQQCQ